MLADLRAARRAQVPLHQQLALGRAAIGRLSHGRGHSTVGQDAIGRLSHGRGHSTVGQDAIGRLSHGRGHSTVGQDAMAACPTGEAIRPSGRTRIGRLSHGRGHSTEELVGGVDFAVVWPSGRDDQQWSSSGWHLSGRLASSAGRVRPGTASGEGCGGRLALWPGRSSERTSTPGGPSQGYGRARISACRTLNQASGFAAHSRQPTACPRVRRASHGQTRAPVGRGRCRRSARPTSFPTTRGSPGPRTARWTYSR